MSVEYDGAGTVRRRYAWGPGVDEPLVWYEGAGLSTTNARILKQDHQGSVISTVNWSGVQLSVNRYDEYGVPASGNQGRFQYTGQAWLPDLGMYYYKARIYSPMLGRFMQTDPIAYEDNINLYTYVENDPLNDTDSSGLSGDCPPDTICVPGYLAPPALIPPIFIPGSSENTAFARRAAEQTTNAIQNLRDAIGALFNENIDVTDPESVEGATPEEVEEAAAEKGWKKSDAKTGADKGTRYLDQSGNRGIRIMKGGGNRTGPDAGVKSSGPYAQIIGGPSAGKVVPLAGNSTLRR